MVLWHLMYQQPWQVFCVANFTQFQRDFFEQPTCEVAQSLLGQVLCVSNNGMVKKGIIVETEAYTQDDAASHSFKRTPRSEIMYGMAGISYVYFIYGMYHCFNIVTEPQDNGAAVLIRALEPLQNLDNTNGPSKLCKQMGIDRKINGMDLLKNETIWLEKGQKIARNDIVFTTRIGIKQEVDLLRRYYIKNNKWVSKK